jgi:hypothetical protein
MTQDLSMLEHNGVTITGRMVEPSGQSRHYWCMIRRGPGRTHSSGSSDDRDSGDHRYEVLNIDQTTGPLKDHTVGIADHVGTSVSTWFMEDRANVQNGHVGRVLREARRLGRPPRAQGSQPSHRRQ